VFARVEKAIHIEDAWRMEHLIEKENMHFVSQPLCMLSSHAIERQKKPPGGRAGSPQTRRMNLLGITSLVVLVVSLLPPISSINGAEQKQDEKAMSLGKSKPLVSATQVKSPM
jgi:negative regulator of sigma E activity